MIIYFNLKTI